MHCQHNSSIHPEASNRKRIAGFGEVRHADKGQCRGLILPGPSISRKATRIAGFHAWRSVGRFVKKGEKGIVIFAPMRLKKRSAKETVSDAATDDDFILRFRAVHVFDVAQTDGEPLPDLARNTR